MTQYLAFQRQPVPQQFEQALQAKTMPAPTRGIIQTENEAFMAPGGAIVQDNWAPTLRGVKLRGGCVRWCDLHALDGPVPPVPSALRKPVISAFEYISGAIVKMFAGQATKLFETTSSAPVLIKSGQTSGNYCAAQLSNAQGQWMLVVNESGDPSLRFNGTTWTTLNYTVPANWANNFAYTVGVRARDTADGSNWQVAVAHTSAAAGTFAADRTAHPTFWTADVASDGAAWITGPAGAAPPKLSYVWKYRNRLYFLEAGTMDAWYLGIDSVGGALAKLPLSGAASKGGRLMFGASWSLDAGDGIDQKNCFVTDLGEVMIFTGTNPSDAANWRQEGLYQVGPPMGMNAHIQVGGDLLIVTVDGIVPLSQAITKDTAQLELAMLTRTIRPMWRDEVAAKRSWAWTLRNWSEYGGLFVTWPGGAPGARYCAVANNATGAWCRFVGYDATCFAQMRADLFFGNQDGIVMQADRAGYDDGVPYLACLVGGWEMFGAPSQQIVWHQARATFHSRGGEPFQPALAATTDFIVVVPPAPLVGPDPGVLDVWDEGKWGPDLGGPPPPVPTAPQRAQYAQWDQPAPGIAPVRNTLWVSIGMTGFAHAPIVQVMVGQQAKPDVELLALSATYERAGVNV